MPKKLLSQQLQQRTDTIEYRAIRSQLMKVAQAGKNEYRVLKLQDKTIMQLQNEGITVEQIKEFDYDKYKLSW